METQDIIKLWKELNINHVNFNFSCGGDSMGDTDIEIYDNEGELVDNSEIRDYFDREVYNNVDFYVNSDGHYQGEFGSVYIELLEDDFNYSKNSQSEWSEEFSGETKVTLTEKQAKFISDYVFNINGTQDDFNINYKKDFIVTDEYEEILKELEQEIIDVATDYYPENVEGEAEEWVQFTTNVEEGQTIITDNQLTLSVSRTYSVIKDE